MMLLVAMVSQMPELHLIQYFLNEKEVENEHERLINPESSGLPWLSRTSSMHSYGTQNTTVNQSSRRQTEEHDDINHTPDFISA